MEEKNKKIIQKENTELKIENQDLKDIIKKLTNELKEEKNKIKELKNNNDALIIKINNLEKELKNNKNNNDALIIKINSLEKELKNNKNKNESELNNLLKNEKLINYNKLLQLLGEKEEKIKKLEELKSRYPFELSEGEELMSIIFNSTDQQIQASMICKNTDLFSTIEKKLYDIYKQYGEQENYFMSNGNKITRHKTLKENGIHDGNVIVLNKVDFD